MSTTRTSGKKPVGRRRRFVAVGAAGVASLALLASGCTDERWPITRSVDLPGADEVVELTAARSCDDLAERVTPMLLESLEMTWGPEGGWSGSDDMAGADSVSGEAATSGASDSAEGSGMADGSGFASGGGTDGAGGMDNAAAPATTTAPDATRDVAGAPGSDTDEQTSSSRVTGTNNQEQDVEEGDLVKTDGRRIVSIIDGVLRLTSLDGSPAVDGVLDLDVRSATELFLRGDQALVLGTSYGDPFQSENRPIPMPAPDRTGPDSTAPTSTAPTTVVPTTGVPTTGVPTTDVPATTQPAPVPMSPLRMPGFAVATTLTLVSLTDPAAPTVIGSAEVEGTLVSARESGGRARIVVRSNPVVVDHMSSAPDRAAAVAMMETVDRGDLVPRVALDGRVGPLGDCDDVMVTASATTPGDGGASSSDAIASDDATGFQTGGVSTVTVLSVGDDLTDLRPTSIQGAAETIYASPSALYVAAGSWDQGGPRTDLHRFDLTGDGPAAYTGSGRAPGRLLNQFSLSDRGGALRVVTTVEGESAGGPSTGGMPWSGGGTEAIGTWTTSARLTVLDTTAPTMAEIGHLDGLGVGEAVQSVRFMDDLAYVVTFRQTDPLYALDLSDPRAPTVLGELKIPGFSQYLHPAGEGLLLGVGREADPDTGRDEGLKISLFDVSDPLRMAEVDRIVMPGAWSPVSDDHKAFTWDADRRQAIIPIEGSCGAAAQCRDAGSGGALVVGVEGRSLIGRAQLTHDSFLGPLTPFRSMVVGDDLWTLSYAGLGRSDAATPSTPDLVAF